MEHRMGFEPMNTGFADQRVSHFATGALKTSIRSCPSRLFRRARPLRLCRCVRLRHWRVCASARMRLLRILRARGARWFYVLGPAHETPTSARTSASEGTGILLGVRACSSTAAKIQRRALLPDARSAIWCIMELWHRADDPSAPGSGDIAAERSLPQREAAQNQNSAESGL
jgi:hypothetical protein